MRNNNEKPKIIVFLPSFENGGLERSTVSIANYLVARGYSIEMMCVRVSGTQIINLDKRISVSRDNYFIPPSIYRSFPFLLIHPRIIDCINITIPFLKKAILNRQGTLILSVQNSIYSVILCRLINIKIIIRSANNPNSSLEYAENKLFAWLITLIKKNIYKNSSAVIANSIDFSKELSDSVNYPVSAIYNPTLDFVDIDKRKLDAVHHPWVENEQIFTLVSVGRLTKQKDFGTLIKALSLIEDNDVRLLIIGEGNLEPDLKCLASRLGVEERIDFLGHLENPINYVYRSKLFVLSSVYEGLPNALLEAVAVGTPVISTDCKSGPSEILLSGEGGMLVNVGDFEALAKGILEIKQNYHTALERAAKARCEADRFTPEVAGQKYLKLVESVWAS